MINITEQQIRTIFDKFNVLYFNGSLPQPRYIEFKFVKKYLGQFHWEGNYHLANGKINPKAYSILRLSTAWEMTIEEIERVIIHEMVHSWQWTVGHCDHHGVWFKHKANEINRITNNKYNIARLTNIENKVCLKDAKKNDYSGVLILYNKTGHSKTLYAVCPEKSYSRIRSWFPNHTGISNCRFYKATGKALTLAKKSVTRVHGYEANDNLNAALKECIIRELK